MKEYHLPPNLGLSLEVFTCARLYLFHLECLVTIGNCLISMKQAMCSGIKDGLPAPPLLPHLCELNSVHSFVRLLAVFPMLIYKCIVT